ncbi:Heat Labile Enterotoxin Type Iib [Metarhizium guizhouense ARSEF 977]|uniref:Heat Labile Enterotoxin Type Iib n=1 Tax=Metarhizium guizhouense (strain ARSEF 977) TaxID=1276136 RepID=A0A0B4H2M0_METGA|nr:Heat Labile Enterotoxin Type Iib [Metarhizium guizhouense ARSEF 977]
MDDCVLEPPETLHNQDEAPTTVETAEDGELMAVAKERSKESFDNLLQEFNYGSVVKQDQLYNELNARLPKFSTPRPEKIARLTTKIGEGALAVAGLALWGKAVADVFSEDTSVLDKAEVVTSIMPIIGCAVQLANSVKQGHGSDDAGHLALCFAADALLFAGFWEIAVVMQVGEALGNWIKAENQRTKLWDGDILAQKGSEGWHDNVVRMLEHLKSDEFLANTTAQFSTYQILILYQASQLTGDLHASHKAIAANTSIPAVQPDQSTTINAHIQPELQRQVCIAIAESKHQLQQKIESIALKHIAKLEQDFKARFLDDWFKAATTPAPILGITLPDLESKTAEIKKNIETARKTPLPLHEDDIKRAIKEVIERLPTPAPCQCVLPGKKTGKMAKCQWAGCSNPALPQGLIDAGGRVNLIDIQSEQDGKRRRLSDDYMALFKPCPVSGSTNAIGRQLWCEKESLINGN